MSTSNNFLTRDHHNLMFPLAIVTAVAMLVGWFPLTTLWHQQSQLDATAAQLHALAQQQRSLQRQASTLDTKAAVTALAREQYQLVAPGQSLIQVMPGNASGQVSANSVDPGFQPLVAPSSGATVTTVATRRPRHVTTGFVSRLVDTLEFWR